MMLQQFVLWGLCIGRSSRPLRLCCFTLRCQAAGQSVGEQHCRCAKLRTVRYSYRNLQHSCNILSAEHQQCEPIREQNSNYSAIWLVCMVGSVVTWSCKNAANHCNVADWLSHGLSCDPSCAGICSIQSRNLCGLEIGTQFPDSENARHNCKFLEYTNILYNLVKQKYCVT